MTANSMSPKLTPEQDAAIRGILDRVKYVPKVSMTWGRGDFAKVKSLCIDLQGYRPTGSCLACHFKALNILREAVGVPPVGGEASESLRSRRLDICRGVAPDGSDACPAYHPDTDSCGRLLVDAFVPEVVKMHDGRKIEPCGCNVSVKSSFKFFRCPAAKWPSK